MSKRFQVAHLDFVRTAKAEEKEWVGLPQGICIAILFCFIHRLTTGETVEETFFKSGKVAGDYQI